MMKRYIEFKVEGDPTGKGRPRFVRSGRAFTPKKTADYEEAVRKAYRGEAGSHMFDDVPLEAYICAYYKVPKSVSKRQKALMHDGAIVPTKKPDADNIAKAVLDALNGVAYKDDSQIVVLTVEKVYAIDEPHVDVVIREASLGVWPL